jgi:receptor protein-tyrosine kinase
VKRNTGQGFISALDDPTSSAAEQYRHLAVRLEGLWKQPGFQALAITSSLPGEGKSLTAINVACVLAKDFGRRVVVVDGDFRRPSLWRYAGDAPSLGLSDVVSGQKTAASVVKSLRYQNVDLLEVGLTRMNPTRLWRAQAVERVFADLRGHYDYLIVDTPPVLTVVDTTLIASLVDGVVVVVRSGVTPKAMLQKAIASLPRAKLVGTVLNATQGLRSSFNYRQ